MMAPSVIADRSRFFLSVANASAHSLASLTCFDSAFTFMPAPVTVGKAGLPASLGQPNTPMFVIFALSAEAANHEPIGYIAALPARKACSRSAYGRVIA